MDLGVFFEAKEWAKANIVKVYSDEETGGKGEILISNTTVQKYLTKSAVDKSESIDVHLSVLKVLPEIIVKSIVAEIHPDFVKVDGVRKAGNEINRKIIVQRLFGCVALDFLLYRVKITLKISVFEHNTPCVPHSYEATKIELIENNLIVNEDGLNPISSIFNHKIDLLAGTLGNAIEHRATPDTNFSISAAKLLKNVELSYQKGKYFFS